MDLSNKTALIPGASRPVGRAIADHFGNLGVHLLLPVFDWPESINEMQQEFSAKNYHFSCFSTDLREERQVEKLVRDLEYQKITSLDYLINNIERGGMPVVHGDYSLQHNHGQWDLEIATTLKAKYLLFRACRPLLQNSDSASVVNISSVAGLVGRAGAAAPFFADAYSAANRAIASFTESWARELAPTIRVNELMLGLIAGRHGEHTRGWQALSSEERKELLRHTLLGRTGTPEEVAKAVRFLAVEASYLTGTVVRMDGGYVLGADPAPLMPPGILDRDGA